MNKTDALVVADQRQHAETAAADQKQHFGAAALSLFAFAVVFVVVIVVSTFVPPTHDSFALGSIQSVGGRMQSCGVGHFESSFGQTCWMMYY